jgi:fatty acid desaturase
MDSGQMMANINYWAVLVAAFSAFFIGWIWYGPLFGKLWMKLNGFSKEDMHKNALPMPVIMGVNYVATALAALAIAMFIGPEANVGFGVFAGLMIAVFWIATSRLNDVLYERKPMALFWINVGYNVVIYSIMGAILGAWH